MDAVEGLNASNSSPRKYSVVFLAVFTVLLVTTMICTTGMLIGVLSAYPSHHDTQWFWAGGHLLSKGANPYDREVIRQIEGAMGLSVKGSDVPMLRNPPSTLFLLIPIGLLGPRSGVVLWSVLLIFFLVISIASMQSILRATWKPGYLLLAYIFPPALCCIEVGQTGMIVLAGLALFLRLEPSRPFWAGAALSLCAVKPHLLLPFGFALSIWVLARRKWALASGVLVALALESLIAISFDHHIWTQYVSAMRTERVLDEFVPTIGVALRFMLNPLALWIEFIPAAFACAWAVWYYRRNRADWNWTTHGSVLTLVSLIAAPYAWFTDHVLAIPAILFALSRNSKTGSVIILMALWAGTGIRMMSSASLYFKPDMFLGVVWLGWYLYATTDERIRTNSLVAVS